MVFRNRDLFRLCVAIFCIGTSPGDGLGGGSTVAIGAFDRPALFIWESNTDCRRCRTFSPLVARGQPESGHDLHRHAGGQIHRDDGLTWHALSRVDGQSSPPAGHAVGGVGPGGGLPCWIHVAASAASAAGKQRLGEFSFLLAATPCAPEWGLFRGGIVVTGCSSVRPSCRRWPRALADSVCTAHRRTHHSLRRGGAESTRS